MFHHYRVHEHNLYIFIPPINFRSDFMDVSCDVGGEDIVAYLERLAPGSDTYKHNDLHLRPASEKDRQAIDRNWMSQAGEALVITCDRHSLQTSYL